MGILRVEVKRNTDGLLVREKAGSVTDVEASFFHLTSLWLITGSCVAQRAERRIFESLFMVI